MQPLPSKILGAHVVVVVLGDIGRSPRMQYHALSLCSMLHVEKVTVVGYKGEQPLLALHNNLKVDFRYINDSGGDKIKSKFFRVLWKGIFLLYSLFRILVLTIADYNLILIQNPPCLPVFIVAFFLSCLNGSKIIIDWHNLGYTIFQQTMNSTIHPFVLINKWFEMYICRLAHDHICVSEAMKRYLKRDCGIDATVVYDKPPKLFKIEEKSQHPITFIQSLNVPIKSSKLLEDYENQKVALIVSSTSWSADEDFSILLESLVQLENKLETLDTKALRFDQILCIVTGKGELKSHYENQIQILEEQKKLGKRVFIQTAWLLMEDYPKLLASADLGVCLHASSSGLDLPMKVVDMFGCGLPVCALHFPTITELVQENIYGCIFETAEQLEVQLLKLLFTEDGQAQLLEWRENLKSFERWDENWGKSMKPLIIRNLKKKR
jgi:beta-1,4-mannosyltransferase